MPKPTKQLLFRTLLTRSDFLLSILVGVLALATLYYWLLLQTTNFPMMLENLSREPVYFSALLVLVPVALVLFGFNLGLTILLLRTRSGLKWQGGMLLGVAIGGFGAGCPACGAFLLSLVGVTAGLGALPFAGLEFWTASVGVMALTLWRSSSLLERNTCTQDGAGAVSCWRLPGVDLKQSLVLCVLACVLVAGFYAMLTTKGSSFLLAGGSNG